MLGRNAAAPTYVRVHMRGICVRCGGGLCVDVRRKVELSCSCFAVAVIRPLSPTFFLSSCARPADFLSVKRVCGIDRARARERAQEPNFPAVLSPIASDDRFGDVPTFRCREPQLSRSLLAVAFSQNATNLRIARRVIEHNNTYKT